MTTNANSTTNENNDNTTCKRPECADYTREQTEALMQTEEYKAFKEELSKRVNDLIVFVDAHSGRYNCGILISTISLNAADDFCGGVAASGTAGTALCACGQLFKNDTIRSAMRAAAMADLLKS